MEQPSPPQQRKTLIENAVRRCEISQELIRQSTMMLTRIEALFEFDMRGERLPETADQRLTSDMFQTDAGAP